MAEAKLRFLVSVIQNGGVGKIDWGVVAEKNGISKGAASMRYSRIIGSLGTDTSAENGGSPTSSPKRKRNSIAEDGEAPPTPSPKKKRGGRKKVVKSEPEMEREASLPSSIEDMFPELNAPVY